MAPGVDDESRLASLKIEQIFIATLTVIHLQNSHIHIIELQF